MSDNTPTPLSIAKTMTPARRQAVLKMPADAKLPYDAMDPVFRVPLFMAGVLKKASGPDLIMQFSALGLGVRAMIEEDRI